MSSSLDAAPDLEPPTSPPTPSTPRRCPPGCWRAATRMPAIGMGTFGSDRYGTAQVAGAVRGALEVGYRLRGLRGGLRQRGRASGGSSPTPSATAWSRATSSSSCRSCGTTATAPRAVARSVRRTLADLGLDHLDGYFVHWPFPNHHPPAADPDARDPHARPYLHDEFMETWQAMESLVDQGLVRHLGTSNVTVPKLRLILGDARVRPVAERDGAAPVLPAAGAVRPLRRPKASSRSATPRSARPRAPSATGRPATTSTSSTRPWSPPRRPTASTRRWSASSGPSQRGQVPIPFAVKPEQYAANLRAVTTDPLTEAEMSRAARGRPGRPADQGPGVPLARRRSWEDLWDLDGTVRPGRVRRGRHGTMTR